MNPELNLNEVHTDLVRDFLQFSRYQQNQRLKSVQHCFLNLLNYKIREDDTYSGDEVIRFVQDLKDIVEDEVQTELVNSVHTNVLLVQQLLKQAEDWHLTLTYTVSELENREKLNAIRAYDEANKLDSAQPSITVSKASSKMTIPAQDFGAATALKAEVAQLLAENDILKRKLQNFEGQSEESSDSSTPQAQMSLELEAAREQIQALKDVIEANSKGAASSTPSPHIDIESLEKIKHDLLQHQETATLEMEKLRSDLAARENKLRQVQSNLLLAEKELDKKFQATGAYSNMKKILVQKNSIIKNLRSKLAQFDVSASVDDDDVQEPNSSGPTVQVTTPDDEAPQQPQD